VKITERHVRWTVAALVLSNVFLLWRLAVVDAGLDVLRDSAADSAYGVHRIERACSCASR
jgi:hypothetical protein